VDQPYVVTAGKASDNFPLVSPLIGAPTVQPLTTTLSADKLNGTAPLLVTFTVTSSGGTGPYTNNITFGDGVSGASLSHTYGSGGTFVASVKVTDSKGATKVSNSVTITLIAPLNITISTTTKTGKVPLAVGFTSNVKGGVAPYNYTWEFGDGQKSYEANPAHVFKNQGILVTKLTVRDSKGTTKTESVNIVALKKPSLPKGFIPGFETPVLVISLVAALVLVLRRKAN
jgi:PKD repeat protein